MADQAIRQTGKQYQANRQAVSGIRQVAKEDRGVFISTYGCQMNVADSERMYVLLEMENYTPVTSPNHASLIILNSCSVREKPVHKIFSEVGRYKNLKLNNPNLLIGVGGCVGQQEKSKLLKQMPLLDFVFGPDNIDELPSIINEAKNSRVSKARLYNKETYSTSTLVRNPQVSAFVNITKGCDNFCTFCVVPFTRGRLRSRDEMEIVEDIKNLSKRGVKEVTLLGQNVNSYNASSGANFPKLLKLVCEKTDIERIRYTTSHPKDFDQDLVDVMKAHRPRICDYIHLPVQSGNSVVLDRMNRGYTREDYLKKIDMIFCDLPEVSLSTDIIVGFPGETYKQFEDTLSLLDEVPFETLFAFKYSERPFTKAKNFEDQLSEEEKSKRLNTLFDKHNKIALNLSQVYTNKVEEVLVEGKDKNGNYFGRTTKNKLTHFTSDQNLIGKTVKVKIEKSHPHNLKGTLSA